MNFWLLSKKETEQLEYNTVPIESLTSYAPPFDDYYFQLNSWYTQKGLTTKNPERDFVHQLSKIVGHVPVYTKQYEYKTAVWGLSWQEESFVLYRSRRGMSIQVPPAFPKGKLDEFLQALVTLFDVVEIKVPKPHVKPKKKAVRLQVVDGKVVLDENDKAQVKWFEEFKR